MARGGGSDGGLPTKLETTGATVLTFDAPGRLADELDAPGTTVLLDAPGRLSDAQ